MKKLLLFTFSLLLSVSTFATEQDLRKESAKTHECKISSPEKLVCAVTMCNFGTLFGEWSSDCTMYTEQFAVYLATLGFWSKPPKCFGRDQNCNKTGKAQKATPPQGVCANLSGEEKTKCENGVRIANSSCDELGDTSAQSNCYVELAKQNNSCSELTGIPKEKCEGTYNPDNYDLSSCSNIPDVMEQEMCEQSIINNNANPQP